MTRRLAILLVLFLAPFAGAEEIEAPEIPDEVQVHLKMQLATWRTYPWEEAEKQLPPRIWDRVPANKPDVIAFNTRLRQWKPQQKMEWWTPEEEERIAAIQARVKRDEDGAWEHEEGNYSIRSFVSERFTAELAAYVESVGNVFNDIMPVTLPDSFRVEVTAHTAGQAGRFRAFEFVGNYTDSREDPSGRMCAPMAPIFPSAATRNSGAY
jgi:hypothetical protein